MTNFAHEKTLIVLADGRRARIYEELARGAELREALAMTLSEDEAYEPQDRRARVFSSVGSHRSGTGPDDSLHEREEENFLRRVASAVEERAREDVALVLMAPPRALGILRGLLSKDAAGKIAHEAAKDVVDEDAGAVRGRLKELRLG